MKRCNACGAQVDEQALYCTVCGSADLGVMATHNGVPVDGTVQTVGEEQPDKNGNILAGVVGAFLFALIGGAAYFLIYQLGFIAGISGLIIFVLATFGYGLFSKAKAESPKAGLIVAVIMTVFMIFAAEYTCLAYEIFDAFKDYDITFFDAFRSVPEFLADSEVQTAVIEDLLFAYLFGLAAMISHIVKSRKTK